jgi:hypothetical protein
MIADRRKDQQKTSKRAPKKVSNADRSIATGKAKRDAAMKARRGMTQEKKPSTMEVEREVYRQSRKTATAKKNAEKKASGGRLPPNSSLRDSKAKQGGPGGKKPGAASAPAAIFGGRTPSKKQIEAAIKGMESIGQPCPPGHSVLITFIPVVTDPKPDPKGKKGPPGGGGPPRNQNNNNNNNNNSHNNNKKGRGYKK